MKAPALRLYYSRQPTDAAPCTALIGPFANHTALTRHLTQAIKDTEDDFPGGEYGPYQIFRCVSRVQPVVTHQVRNTVRLKELDDQNN